MTADLQRDPVTAGGVGKRDAVVKTEGRQVRQTLQQQGEGHFQLDHGLFGPQGFQALPEHVQPVKPEHRTGETGFEFKYQVGVMPLSKTLLITLEFFRGWPTQGGNPFAVGVRISAQDEPVQRSVETQGA